MYGSRAKGCLGSGAQVRTRKVARSVFTSQKGIERNRERDYERGLKGRTRI